MCVCAVIWLKHMGLLCLCLGCVFAFRMFISAVFANPFFCCVFKSIVFMAVFANPLFLWLSLQIHCLDCCKIVVDRRVTGMNAGLEILEQISIN